VLRALGLFLRNVLDPSPKNDHPNGMGGYRQATEPYRAASVRTISSDGLWAAEYGNHIRVA
jgi:hypothetical protein